MNALAGVRATDEPHGLVEKAAHVVLEGQVPIGVRRHPPVDDVHIEPPGQVLPDHALVRLEVEDVGPVDERVAEEHRLGPGRRRLPPVAKEPVGPAAVHHVASGRAYARFLRRGESERVGEESSPEAERLRV